MATKFSQLRDDLYESNPESRDRVADEVSRLDERIGLRDLRNRVGLTQATIAERLGTTQPGVSRIESQDDALVSTVAQFVRATGGDLSLLASYPDGIHELTLAGNRPERGDERRFRIVWQHQSSRRLVQIAWLHSGPGHFLFHYTSAAETESDFESLPPFPDLRTTYRSSRLWPYFTQALVEGIGATLDEVTDLFALPDDQAQPVELLAEARVGTAPSAQHTIQIIPEPVTTRRGEESMFLASGLRHAGPPKRVNLDLATLRPGDQILLIDEPTNEHNSRAVQLRGRAGQPFGYVPDHLLDYLHKNREHGRVEVSVVNATGPEVKNWHLRLLCRMTVASH